MLEHVQMLRDGRQADIVRARELAHDRVTAGKLFQDRSPDRMGQRREHGVELLSDHGSINHLVNRMVAGYSTIWLTDIFRTTRCRRFCRNASTKIEDLMWEATQESIAPCGVPLRLYRTRSEEHTSELQSRFDLVCRLLLEKKKQ